jgi:hypothetical protein
LPQFVKTDVSSSDFLLKGVLTCLESGAVEFYFEGAHNAAPRPHVIGGGAHCTRSRSQMASNAVPKACGHQGGCASAWQPLARGFSLKVLYLA